MGSQSRHGCIDETHGTGMPPKHDQRQNHDGELEVPTGLQFCTQQFNYNVREKRTITEAF